MSDPTHTRTAAVMPVTTEPVPSGLPALVRNAYWHGKTMGVDEFVRDQEYHRATQQTLARLTVGSGVLCGLSVSPSGAAGVAVSRGAALDGHGRLVLVDHDVVIDDLGRWICGAGPDEPLSPPGEYVLCVLLHECPVLPAPVLVTDCDTRMECRPGAVAERFRFEARRVERPHCAPACPGCAHRSSGRGHCGCGGSGRDCAPVGDECVAVAWFRWDGTAASGVTSDGRSEITSLQRLGAPREDGDDVVGPRLVGLWPRPGQTLDREGTPSEWGRWRYRPRIELCFDRAVDQDRVDDPDDWVRAWVVVPTADGGGEANPPVVRRVRLRMLSGATTSTGDGQTLVLVFDPDATVDAVDEAAVGRGFTVVVVARASTDTGPAGAGAVSRPAQLEYAGTGLTSREVERLWSSGELPDDAPGRLIGASAPDCFGDGYDGGLLHAAFTVAPVGDAAAVTALSPHNGARVRGAAVPRIEVSSTADLEGLAPKVWLVGVDGSVTPLTVGAPEPLRRGAAQGARSRYASGFDTTLDAELALTVAFPVTAPATAPDRGRVLVATPAPGSFAGTCLSEAEVADAYAHGLATAHTSSVRPSSARMPRAGSTGAWIHWTFAWEQTDDLR